MPDAVVPRFDYFFDLPPEIREQILQQICIVPGGIHVCGDESTRRPPQDAAPSSPWQQPQVGAGERDHHPEHHLGLIAEDEDEDEATPHVPLNLFLANSQLYREAAAIYYGQNVFHLDPTARRPLLEPMLDPETGLLTSAAALPARRRIRRVVLYVRRLGGLFQQTVGPALSDMALRGALRGLEVFVRKTGPRPGPWPNHPVTATYCVEPGPGGWDRAAHDRFGTSPRFTALLRLLADPDLEEVALRVEASEHYPFWCWFHPPSVETRVRSSVPFITHDDDVAVTSAEQRPTTMAGPSKWLDIDVNALLRAYGEGDALTKIMKVGEKTW